MRRAKSSSKIRPLMKSPVISKPEKKRYPKQTDATSGFNVPGYGYARVLPGAVTQTNALTARLRFYRGRVAAASLVMAASELPLLRTMLPSSGAESLSRRRKILTWTLSRKSRALRNIVGLRICTVNLQRGCTPGTPLRLERKSTAWVPAASVNFKCPQVILTQMYFRPLGPGPLSQLLR